MLNPLIHALTTTINLVLSTGDHIELAPGVGHTLVQRIGSRSDGLNFERLGVPTGAHFRRHDSLHILFHVYVIDDHQGPVPDHDVKRSSDTKGLGRFKRQWRRLPYTTGIPSLSGPHVSRNHYRHIASASMKYGDRGLKPRPVDDEMARRHRHGNRTSRRTSLAVGKGDN